MLAHILLQMIRAFIIRRYKFIIAVLALILAAYLAYIRPLTGGLSESSNTAVDEAVSSIAFRSGDLENLRILYRVIYLVQQRYLDASRIDSKRMLSRGLSAIQREIPEVMVNGTEEGKFVDLRVNSELKRFRLADVASPPAMLSRFKEIFTFIKKNLKDTEIDLNDIQYSAINGMLLTLDPHTVLLTPKVYKEMKLGTRGEFGGLGIVISIRDGQLTIISPIDGTPAAKAGLKRMDRIVKIGEESTVNMSLTEAVNLLRGKPGTSVSIWVNRKEWDEARRFDIVRAIIHIESVESVMLKDHVGYVRIKNFQRNTAPDLRIHLKKLREKKMKGLILDLRNNPGGLLESAVDVADLFIEKGPIVTTAGRNPADRDVKRARAGITEPEYPVICLVNGGSASASEIVSGAIQATGRGLIVGEPTFGKGSVQVLYDFDDGSALKLTIGQYLTPGDISIQLTGVQPDILTRAVVVHKDGVDIEPDEYEFKEKDLSDHLEGAEEKTKPPDQEQVAYLYVDPDTDKADAAGDAEKKKDGDESEEENGGEVEDELKLTVKQLEPDFDVQLARELISNSLKKRSSLDTEKLKPILEKIRDREVMRMSEALSGMGINWEKGKNRESAELSAGLVLVDETGAVAGKTCRLRATVTNNGPGTVYRLRATSRSDNVLFQDREFAFGMLKAGETRSFDVSVKVPESFLSRVDDVSLAFLEAYERTPSDTITRIKITGLGRPRFSVSYGIFDHRGGNSDGLLQKDERVQMDVNVCNKGSNPSIATHVFLRNRSDKSLFIHKGRADLGKLEPGACSDTQFDFEIRTGLESPELRMELEVGDPELQHWFRQDIRLHVSPPGEVPKALGGKVLVSAGASFYERPDDKSGVIGIAGPKASFEVMGISGRYLLVVLDEEKTLGAFVKQESTTEFEGDVAREWERAGGNTAPVIEFDSPVPLVVRSDRITVGGEATDDEEIREVFIFAGDDANLPSSLYEDKVYYTTQGAGSGRKLLAFSAKVPLELGSNYITIVARHGGLEETRHYAIIRRDDPQGVAYFRPGTGRSVPVPVLQMSDTEMNGNE